MKLKNEHYMDNYVIKDVLGKGAYGEVVKVANKYTKV